VPLLHCAAAAQIQGLEKLFEEIAPKVTWSLNVPLLASVKSNCNSFPKTASLVAVSCKPESATEAAVVCPLGVNANGGHGAYPPTASLTNNSYPVLFFDRTMLNSAAPWEFRK
jgi:hypothetical protein